ncbi:MAG: sulfate adenylyltransferase [Betaproteobacteria bacterium]|nr:sulfate adenylyltransferase [Betaproteobacteria bacterium]
MHADHDLRTQAAAAGDAERLPALRFLTAGSVDDGKSTLIGRLLLDSRALLADQLETVGHGNDGSLLAQLTDGLEAEREQGITIDVAYRYFATPRRKFIIADAPGHEQYTRNMVTAAAGSDCAVVLVDVTKLDLAQRPLRLLPQTRRHALLAQLLRVRSLVFAVNKLDAVDDPRAAFDAVQEALREFADGAGIVPAGVIPISALHADNVVQASPRWPWWNGPSLLQLLEGLPAGEPAADGSLLLPVQYVARGHADGGNPRRVLWGRVARGGVRVGQALRVHPGGHGARVAELWHAGVRVDHCAAGQSAGVVLDQHLDVSRGDWLSDAARAPRASREFDATLAWLDSEPAVLGRKYWLRHGHAWVAARIVQVHARLDIHSLQRVEASELAANDIGRVRVQAQSELPLAGYADNRIAGSMILVDAQTHRTSGALLVEAAGQA